jgi:hypothetical protein
MLPRRRGSQSAARLGGVLVWYSYWTMKALLLALFLSAMQTAPPVPRQSADSANQDANKGQKEASQHQSPTAQAPTPKNLPEKAVSEKASTENPAIPNTQQPTRITELPPVSVTRDWIDKTSWTFGGILVVVGIVGVCAAYRTLRAIEQQARIMRRQTGHIARQAQSMRYQTTHLRNSVIQARKGARAAQTSADAAKISADALIAS